METTYAFFTICSIALVVLVLGFITIPTTAVVVFLLSQFSTKGKHTAINSN